MNMIWANLSVEFENLALTPTIPDTQGFDQLMRAHARTGETFWYELKAGRLNHIQTRPVHIPLDGPPLTGPLRHTQDHIDKWNQFWLLIAFRGEVYFCGNSRFQTGMFGTVTVLDRDKIEAVAGKEHWREMARSSARFCRWLSVVQPKPPEPDGPFGQNGFRWAGNEYFELTHKQWQFFNALWNAKHRTLNFVDFAEPVWGSVADSMQCTEDAIGSYRREINRFLDESSIPFKVSVSNVHETVTLESRIISQENPIRA